MEGSQILDMWQAFREVRFRGKARLLSPFLAKEGNVDAKIFGATMSLDLTNYVDWMIYTGCYEPINVHRFRKLLSPGDNVIDVGANIGFFSLLASSLVGERGRVLAIEPHPTNFKVLSETIQRNQIERIIPLQLGLGETPGNGVVEMRDQTEFPNRTASMIAGSGDVKSEVTVETLPRVMEQHGITKASLVKVDVDGFEVPILKGAIPLLQQGAIDYLLVEFNPYWLGASGSSAEQLTGILEAAGMTDITRRDRWAQRMLGPGEDRLFAGAAKT